MPRGQNEQLQIKESGHFLLRMVNNGDSKDPFGAEKHFLASEVTSNESIDHEKRALPESSR